MKPLHFLSYTLLMTSPDDVRHNRNNDCWHSVPLGNILTISPNVHVTVLQCWQRFVDLLVCNERIV